MPPATSRPAIDPKPSSPVPARGATKAINRPFLGLIDPVIVENPVLHPFDGSIDRKSAQAIWIWVVRDLCSDLVDLSRVENEQMEASALEPLIPQVLTRIRDAINDTEARNESARRLQAQMGSQEALDRLPVVINALRCRGLLPKAQGFGRAANAMVDDAALATALQSMPLQDPPVASLLLHAAVGQVTHPNRLISALLKLVGAGTETAIIRAGFGPLIDAMLAHAQNQLFFLQPMGAFADIDLICRALDRYHRLVRAIASFIELPRNGRWALILGSLTTQISERIEPRLREVVPDVNGSLRRREGIDRLDDDRLLAAINGIYLLAAVRDCKDSLALNALFDQSWSQTGQLLETHLERCVEQLRANPSDQVAGRRLDAGIKMAEVRFNADYAETLRRARAAAERRV